MRCCKRVFLVVGLFVVIGCGSSGGGDPPAPPSDNAQLASLALSAGTLSPAFTPEGTAYTCPVGFLAQSTLVTPTAQDGGASITVDGVTTASGAASAPVALSIGSNSIVVEVTAEDGTTTRTYTIALMRGATISHEAYAKASNTQGGDHFGYAVAVSGDTMAVGAYRERSAATGVDGDQSDNTLVNAGAVYVFTRSGTTWTQQAYVKASNPGVGDHFGSAVALSGDTLVVGANGESSNATGVGGNEADDTAVGAGAVYVFTRTGGAWSQQAYLKASNTGAGDLFGRAVAVSGDTVVVGAYQEDSNATGIGGDQSDNSAAEAGAAYVFTRAGGAWTQQAYLKASNAGMGDFFGESVSISGDTIVVGARSEDGSAVGVNGTQDDLENASGAAYVFVRSGSTWSEQAYVKASNTDALDSFGRSVAISGDTIVVGAYREGSNATGVNGDDTDNSLNNAGAAYVFTRAGTSWSQQAYLKASNTESADFFGSSAAVHGDTIVIGTADEDSNATGIDGNESDNSAPGAGAVYVFTRTGTTWMQAAYVKASNTNAGDFFGWDVGVWSDTVVVGAWEEDSNATGIGGDGTNNGEPTSGAAYVVR